MPDDILSAPPRIPFFAADLIHWCCQKANVPVQDVLSPSRFREHHRVRAVVINLLWTRGTFSRARIAELMKRDRSTVGHCIATFKWKYADDPLAKELYETAEATFTPARRGKAHANWG